MNAATHRFATYCLLFLLAVLCHGCDRAIISGAVVNIQGEALPGVAVSVQGTEHQSLTDAAGNYQISYEPGETTLRYDKTGYTPGLLELSVVTPRLVQATTVTLWSLPVSAGVYLYAEGRYAPTLWVEPQRFFIEEGDVIFGTRREAEIATPSARPIIICFNTPRYDARLSRLQRVEAKVNAADAQSTSVWTEAGSVRGDLTRIDEAEGMLLQLEIARPLESGTYAVHWGALDGDPALENRIFIFRVDKDNDAVGSP